MKKSNQAYYELIALQTCEPRNRNVITPYGSQLYTLDHPPFQWDMLYI